MALAVVDTLGRIVLQCNKSRYTLGCRNTDMNLFTQAYKTVNESDSGVLLSSEEKARRLSSYSTSARQPDSSANVNKHLTLIQRELKNQDAEGKRLERRSG